MSSIATPKGRHYGGVNDPIEVGLRLCGESGVKFVPHSLAFEHSNVTPQIAVDRILEFRRSELVTGDTDVRNLSLGVNTRIGSARPYNTDGSVDQHPDDAFKLPLDRTVVLLHLPPVKVRAVVLNEELEVHFEARLPGFIAIDPAPQSGQ